MKMGMNCEKEGDVLLVSFYLTRILVRFNRLSTEYNPRYLPDTIKAADSLICRIENLNDTKKTSDILRMEIERRHKYSCVFSIPEVLLRNPETVGLRDILHNLSTPLIKSYCAEEMRFLKAELYDTETMRLLYQRTKRNCELLKGYCDIQDIQELENMIELCEVALSVGKPLVCA